MTILSAPVPLRFVRHETESWFDPPDTQAARELSETLFGLNSEVSVNAKATNQLKPGARPQLICVIFEDETLLSKVYLGNSAGSARWKRGFGGKLLEIITLSREPDENQHASVLKYLTVKHNLGLPPQKAENPTKTLNDLGISHGGVLATLTLVR